MHNIRTTVSESDDKRSLRNMQRAQLQRTLPTYTRRFGGKQRPLSQRAPRDAVLSDSRGRKSSVVRYRRAKRAKLLDDRRAGGG